MSGTSYSMLTSYSFSSFSDLRIRRGRSNCQLFRLLIFVIVGKGEGKFYDCFSQCFLQALEMVRARVSSKI